MRPEEAQTILDEIEQNTRDDDILHDLYQDLLVTSLRYARLRAEWFVAGLEARQEMDARRTAAHDALIDACNILSRAMHQRGKSTAWRRQVGENRKEIGDFACWLHAVMGIRAR